METIVAFRMLSCQQTAIMLPMSEPLTENDMARWVAWKRATEAVMGNVASDIAVATGLSSADFSVLTRVVEEGGGSLRQQRLSDELGWERSRLSRQLVRMEQRNLVRRDGSAVERRVTATPQGHKLASQARLIHAESVRQHLIEAIPGDLADEFWAAVSYLTADQRTTSPGE